MNDGGTVAGVDRRLAWALAGLAAVGLVLRLLAARGALWLDEAWSAIFARDALTPATIFFGVNHDNNHFLNTWWMQIVGWDAAPMLSRGLSIACGTAAVVVAGLIGARRGPSAALFGAALFAVSPMLLTYGAEARGYAPMLLALTVAVLLVDRALAGVAVRGTPQWLGVAAGLGMLSHLTMLFGIGALTAWVAIASVRRFPLGQAIVATVTLMGRALLAVVAVVAMLAFAAWRSPLGYRVGSYTPFGFDRFAAALGEMIAYTVGAPPAFGWPLLVITLVLVPLALWRLPPLAERWPLYLLLIVGLPLAVALLRIGNTAYPRYFIVASVALLLLVADALALALRSGGIGRGAAILIFPALVIGSLALDGRIIAQRRADPGAAIVAMRARAPGGAVVLITSTRSSAVLEVAGASSGYTLRVSEGCVGARFLFVDEDGHAPLPARRNACGEAYRAIVGRGFSDLSGQTWQLYEREGR